MRRIFLIVALSILFFSGCKSEEPEATLKETVVMVYTMNTELEDGLQLEEKWTIEGWDNDRLSKTTAQYIYKFDDLNARSDYINRLEETLDQRIAMLQGPEGSDYIILEYLVDGDQFVATETTDYEQAGKNQEGIMMNDVLEDGMYFSMSELCDNFKGRGYTLQD